MRTVLRGGLVFDGSGSAPVPADVVFEGERILAVGTSLDGDRAVDVAGATILPGLFDCHVHLTMSGDLDVLRHASRPFSLRYFEAVHNMEATLSAGITTVRDASGADLGVKEAVIRKLVRGPRMQIAITMLSQTGGHGDEHLPSGACMAWQGAYPGNPQGVVDGPEEIRRRVRELVREGADVIKVATSGGVLSPRDKPTHAHFRDDELAMLVAEATAADLAVMAHAQATEGIKAAVRAGVRSVEHGVYLDDEALSLMLDRGTWLVPTLSAPAAVLAAGRAGVQVPEVVLRKAEEVIEVHLESFARAVDAGVRIAMGTDSGVGPHGRNLEELPRMVSGSKMTALDAWRATTSSSAALLGLGEQLGTVEPGKRADFVLLDGPLDDLERLGSRVRGVWKDGEPLVGAAGAPEFVRG